MLALPFVSLMSRRTPLADLSPETSFAPSSTTLAVWVDFVPHPGKVFFRVVDVVPPVGTLVPPR